MKVWWSRFNGRKWTLRKMKILGQTATKDPLICSAKSSFNAGCLFYFLGAEQVTAYQKTRQAGDPSLKEHVSVSCVPHCAPSALSPVLCPQIITTEEYWVSNVLGTVVASLILLVALIDTMHPSNNCWVGSTHSWDRASSGLSGSWHWLGALCSSVHLVDLQVWELGKCWILLTSTRHRFKMQSYCPFTHSWSRMAMWAK